MTNDWTEQPLSELCCFLNRGITPHYVEAGGLLILNQKCVRDQRVSFIKARRTGSAINPATADRMLRPLDILVNSTGVGTVGRVAQVLNVPEPAVVDSHLTIVRADPSRVYPHYLGYALRRLQPEIEMLAEGSTGQTELSRRRLGSLLVPMPPEPEQRVIAHVLGALDDKIDLNQRTTETLESISRAIFRSWFVDFDPIRAKIAGIELNVSSAISDLFPTGFSDSDFGAVPESWPVTQLGDHLDIEKGLSYKGSSLSETGVPLHNLNSIYEGGGYKHAGIKYYNGDFARRHCLQPGDLIVANTEQGHDRLLIGYAAIVPRHFGPTGIFSHHLYRVRVKETSHITPDFLCHMLNSQRMHDTVSGYANGTTVNMMPADGLCFPRFALPPAGMIRAFDQIAVSARERQEKLMLQSRTLGALVDALSVRLISGQLRITDEQQFALPAAPSVVRNFSQDHARSIPLPRII